MTLLEHFRAGYQQGRAKAAPAQAGRHKPRKVAKPRPAKPRVGGLILLGLATVLLAAPGILILGLCLLAGGAPKRGLMRMGGDIDRDRS